MINEKSIKATSELLIAHKADPMLDSFYAGSVFYLHELKVRFQVKKPKKKTGKLCPTLHTQRGK
jgi:hypothetical protein